MIKKTRAKQLKGIVCKELHQKYNLISENDCEIILEKINTNTEQDNG